jgi:hypothetical protein
MGGVFEYASPGSLSPWAPFRFDALSAASMAESADLGVRNETGSGTAEDIIRKENSESPPAEVVGDDGAVSTTAEGLMLMLLSGEKFSPSPEPCKRANFRGRFACLNPLGLLHAMQLLHPLRSARPVRISTNLVRFVSRA